MEPPPPTARHRHPNSRAPRGRTPGSRPGPPRRPPPAPSRARRRRRWGTARVERGRGRAGGGVSTFGQGSGRRRRRRVAQPQVRPAGGRSAELAGPPRGACAHHHAPGRPGACAWRRRPGSGCPAAPAGGAYTRRRGSIQGMRRRAVVGRAQGSMRSVGAAAASSPARAHHVAEQRRHGAAVQAQRALVADHLAQAAGQGWQGRRSVGGGCVGGRMGACEGLGQRVAGSGPVVKVGSRTRPVVKVAAAASCSNTSSLPPAAPAPGLAAKQQARSRALRAPVAGVEVDVGGRQHLGQRRALAHHLQPRLDGVKGLQGGRSRGWG